MKKQLKEIIRVYYKMFRQLFATLFFLFSLANNNVKGDFMFSYDNKNEYFEPESVASLPVADSFHLSLPVADSFHLSLRGSLVNATTSYLYTYSQSGHRFSGPAYDGTNIDTTGCCSGQSGSCRNNPACQCQVAVGPLPQGTYSLGNMMTFKGMPYCYELYPASSNSMCGRSGFLIHGGGCSGNPSEGCIVIENQDTRYKIKTGATLKVVY